MNKQRKTSNILNVFQYDESTGIIGLNGVPVSGYALYLHTNLNDGSVGLDSSASINAMYLLKNGTKSFEISYDTTNTNPIFRLLPYQSSSFFQIGNPSNAGADYIFIAEATYGNVMIGPGLGNGTGNLTGATASIHKIQLHGKVFGDDTIQASGFKVTGGSGFIKADGTTDTTTYLSGNQSITISGDASASGTTSLVLTLANTAVTAGTYGSSTLVPVVTVDSKGRITNVTTASISGALTFTGDVTGTGTTGSSTALTLANSGVTAGTYTKVTVDAKGRVTVGASASTSDISEGTNLYYTDARVLSYLTTNSYATQTYVGTQIANLVASAPAALDTLNELAAALGNDPNFATSIATSIGTKQAQLNGTGFVKVSGTTVSYDNSTYLTGITSSLVTTALGFTPYNATNPNGYISSYTETSTLANVTARGASTSTAVTFSGGATISNLLINGAAAYTEGSLALGAMGTGEGGQLVLNKATSYTYAAHLDIWQDVFRLLYGTNTTTSGVALSVNLSTRQLILPAYTTSSTFTGTAAGVLAFDSSGNILTIAVPGGAVSSVNAGTGVSVNQNTGAVTVSIGQSVATSAVVTFDQVITGNNGNGTNFRIGDDVWIGDINVANTFRIQGVQDATNGYIVFGNSNATALGRSGTGALTYGGNTIYHAGNLTNLNQLTNGPGYITGITSANVTTALGFTPYNSTNPSGYITSSSNISGYAMSLNGYANQTEYIILTGPANGPVIKIRYDSATANRYIDIGSKDGNGVYSEGLKIYNGGTLTFGGNTIWHQGNLTNLNQLTNGPGYLTGITSSQVITALGYTPYNGATNPNGYITGVTNISGYSNNLVTQDIRTISPSTHGAGRLNFGFTSWSNNNTANWADYIHLRSYTDSSGGADNLIMFLKSGIGMRIWQQTWGSSTAYSSYVDVLHSSNYSSYALPLSGGTMTGSLVNNTDGAVLMESNASENNNWLFKENSKAWGLFWFNRGSQSGQTVGGYTTIGAELMFMGGSSGIAMPSGWTGYYSGSYIAAMISNYNGYIYSASTIYAATSMIVGGNTVLHAGNYSGYSSFSGAISGSTLTLGSSSWSAHSLHFSSGWGTGGAHATIGSGYTGITAAGIMLGNPHIPFRSSYGAKMRMASDQAASYYWDAGINVEASGTSIDNYYITRNSVRLFTIDASGNATISASAYANGNRLVENTGTWAISISGSAGSAGSALGIGYDGNSISGMGPISTWDSRPAVGMAGYGINWHTGVSISGYPGYGGVRLYASGYPTHASSVLRLEASGAVYTYGGLYSDGNAVIHAGNIGSQSVSYSSNSGGLNGWGYTSYAYRSSGSGYYQIDTWLQMNGNHGMYWPSYYGAHIYPNDGGSYGAVRINGTKNGWKGIYFDSGNTLMMNSTESGHYQDGYGWKWRWYAGQLYVSRSTYGGGTEYTILDAGNVSSYAVTGGSDPVLKSLRFSGVGGDSGNGSQFDSYAIYQQGGGWGYPYPDLCIGYHTGIKMGAYWNYGGIRIYNNADWATITASFHDGDNNFRGYYDIIAYASDKRLKHNIKPIENALSKVISLIGMTYQWNEIGAQHGWEPDTETREVGVFAQDVQVVLPEAVKLAPFDQAHDSNGNKYSKSGENFLTVKYEKLVPLLIEAIKEQQLQIEELQNKLDNVLSSR